MNRTRFLLVLGADPVRWARRFDIVPFSHPCSRCGAELTTSVPFIYDDMRGLVAPTCACGNERTPYGMVRAHGDILTSKATSGSKEPGGRRISRRARPRLRIVRTSGE